MKPIFNAFATGAAVVSLAAAQTPRYTVSDLGTFGGSFSIAFGVNNAGRIAGAAAVPGGNHHPFLSGIFGKTDLGTLGGPNAHGSGINERAEVSILSETSTPDPLKEDFCGFGNRLICLGGLWDGMIKPLPTLGGNNAIAFGLNNRGQIFGLAENGTHDASCPAPQVLDYEAVIWGPNPADIQELPPLPGDTVGLALSINDRGQVAGVSGLCSNTVKAVGGLVLGPHAVLWDDGRAIHLSGLGGSVGKAGAINNRGEVAGLASLPGDTAIHSVLWTDDGVVHDLGALGSDAVGDPAGLNNSTQVVGGSCDAGGNCRAFLWEKNVMTDLNDLIGSNAPLYLIYALGINDAGEIVGLAFDKSTGGLHAYVATPTRRKSGEPDAADAAPGVTADRAPVPIPETVRRVLRQHLPGVPLGVLRP